VQYLVALIGLGVAIDYSLLIVMRWREERARGLDSTAAVQAAMVTAGRSVVFSGVTVAVSLAALVLVPLPFLRSIGLGGLLIPLLSVATATTLVPVVLAAAGSRLQWPRRRITDPSSRAWRRIATVAVRHPVIVALVSLVLLLGLAAPLLGLRLGSPRLDAYDPGTPAGAAAAQVTAAGIAPGILRPTEVLLPPAEAAGAVGRFAALPGVAAAVAPDSAGWVTPAGQLVQVWTSQDPAAESSRDALRAVRDVARTIPGAQVGGHPAEDADFVAAVYGDAPLVVLGIVVVTFLLLARALRSLWLPIKALLLNVVSIAAAYGITVLIWQDGAGSELLFGTAASGAITIWVPIAVFAFLFGLSMDYEVFILSRMREAYDEHGSTPRAVVDGIARTGRLVTSAALILFLAFIALSTVPAVEVKILATALALGIAIDALIVRAALAPALVVLLGRLNWSIPRGLAVLLRLPPPP
jgi:RND superfamily putative drug exporter